MVSVDLVKSQDPHGANLFYKSNQTRLNAHNKQRSQDLINQIKQKECFNALNHQPVYNEEDANQLAGTHAKLIEAKVYIYIYKI
jgi:hypothetical protein